MSSSHEVVFMLEYVIKLFVTSAYTNNLAPSVVDAVPLDDNTLEITMTDEKVFIIKVEEIDYGQGEEEG